MLLVALGVIQMKFDGVAELSSAMASSSVVFVNGWTWAHRVGLFATVEKKMNGTCLTSPLLVSHGPDAGSAYMFQFLPAASRLSAKLFAVYT